MRHPFHRQSETHREVTFTLTLPDLAGQSVEITYRVEAFVAVAGDGAWGTVSARPTEVRLSGRTERLDF